jgi:hypothetical protein
MRGVVPFTCGEAHPTREPVGGRKSKGGGGGEAGRRSRDALEAGRAVGAHILGVHLRLGGEERLDGRLVPVR